MINESIKKCEYPYFRQRLLLNILAPFELANCSTAAAITIAIGFNERRRRHEF
jgi:hypothetical protein